MNVLITGAGKGIGKAIALKFAAQKYNLAICSRTEEDLISLKKEILLLNPTATVLYKIVDVSNKQAIQVFAKEVLLEMKQIDVLINNAGVFKPGDIATEEDGLLEEMIQTNLYSAYYLTRAILPSMMENNRGAIINISSVAGLQAYTHGGSYSISKFALQGFSKNLREELKNKNIKVITVNPGATMSNSWSGSGIDENRIMKANDVADVVYQVTTLSDQAVVEDIVLRPLLGDL
jgi:short-subunit dehydrogenase